MNMRFLGKSWLKREERNEEIRDKDIGQADLSDPFQYDSILY